MDLQKLTRHLSQYFPTTGLVERFGLVHIYGQRVLRLCGQGCPFISRRQRAEIASTLQRR